MEISNFISILKKHKYALMVVPVLVMLITFALVKNQADTYVSKSRLAAGIVDQQALSDKEGMQESKINQTFSNLIQMLQLKTVYDQVSYQLMIHDLTSEVPLKKPSKLFSTLNTDARRHALEVYTRMYNNRQALSLADPDQKGLDEVLKSMKYDNESLRNKMKVYRVENSDFIQLEYEAENPALSAFVINTMCREFISYYTSLTKLNGLKTIDFLGDLLKRKKDSLNSRMEDLKAFKIKNRVLNLNEQAKSLYGQMSDFETRIEVAQKDVESITGALRGIDSKFNAGEKGYLESQTSLINQDIVATKDQLNLLNEAYIKSDFNELYKYKIDSTRKVLTTQIDQSTDRHILNPLSTKENLIAQKLRLEIDLALAKNSIQSLQGELEKLNRKFDMLVPNEAVIQSYEGEINVASQEYIEILKKFNQTNMDFNSSVKLKQVEIGMPGILQPSKKVILVILSGIVSIVFYLIVLFVLFYLDDSIKVATDLAGKTDTKVLGYLPLINLPFLDIQLLWDKYSEKPLTREFKNLLRAIRFEIGMGMRGGRTLLVTSLMQGEGKTLLCISLASAYQMINKKVLIIDGNFDDPDITRITQPKYFIEDFLSSKISLSQVPNEDNVSVLGNRGRDLSLFEIASEKVVSQKLTELKDNYDIIIIEASALNTLNKSKEWIVVTDKVLAVFEANNRISNTDMEQINYLKKLNSKFIGWVLNRVTNESPKTSSANPFLRKTDIQDDFDDL